MSHHSGYHYIICFKPQLARFFQGACSSLQFTKWTAKDTAGAWTRLRSASVVQWKWTKLIKPSCASRSVKKMRLFNHTRHYARFTCKFLILKKTQKCLFLFTLKGLSNNQHRIIKFVVTCCEVSFIYSSGFYGKWYHLWCKNKTIVWIGLYSNVLIFIYSDIYIYIFSE